MAAPPGANSTSVGELPLGSSRTRLPALDGLRSWVILVMLAHFGNFDNPASGEWLQRGFLFLAQIAFVGLDVFFVLSGFLITRILLDTRTGRSFFRTFYLRRALRILPLYYGFLLAYFVVLPRFASWADTTGTGMQQLFYWIYLQNFLAGQMWATAEGSFISSTGHLWSLAVEEQFYLIWPLVVYLASQRNLKMVCLAAMILAPVARIFFVMTEFGGSPGVAYALTPARLDGLALGSLLAILARERGGLDMFRRWAGLIGAASFATLGMMFAGYDEHGSESWQFLTIGLTASVYLAGALVVLTLFAREGGITKRILESWPLGQVGRYSYATYVFHFPLGYTMSHASLLTKDWFHAQIPGYLLGELSYCAVLMLLCIGAGALSWHSFERPILAMRKYVPYGRMR